MTPDAATVIAYSAGLFALIFVFFLFSSRGKPEQAWFGLPFAFGSLAAILLVHPTVLPGLWGPRLAVFCVLLAYGAAWQITRVIGGRKPLLFAALVPCAAWLGFSSAFVHDLQGWPEVVSAIARALLIAAFNGLAAREFWREPKEQLPSAALLCRVFAVFAGFHLLRALGVVWLPAPLGTAPPEIWAVALYNLAVVTQALLASAFIIALLRETVAAENHRLAFQDVMTGVGNRRAFQAKILEYADREEPRGLALIVFDIDPFKIDQRSFRSRLWRSCHRPCRRGRQKGSPPPRPDIPHRRRGVCLSDRGRDRAGGVRDWRTLTENLRRGSAPRRHDRGCGNDQHRRGGAALLHGRNDLARSRRRRAL